jgi:hypothetical protein
MTNDVAELVTDLRAMAAGHLTESAFREKYSSRDFAELQAVWHGLQHYFADADIRAKDADHRRMQLQELERLIQKLEAGSSPRELGRIGFLGASEP